LLSRIPKLQPDERKEFGKMVNELKEEMTARIDEAIFNLKKQRFSLPLMDLTLPGRNLLNGHLHPITIVRKEIEDILIPHYQFDIYERGMYLYLLNPT